MPARQPVGSSCVEPGIEAPITVPDVAADPVPAAIAHATAAIASADASVRAAVAGRGIRLDIGVPARWRESRQRGRPPRGLPAATIWSDPGRLISQPATIDWRYQGGTVAIHR